MGAELSDTLWFPCWLAATSLLVASGWVVSCRLYPEGSRVLRWLTTIILCWGCVVLIALPLGAVGLISKWTLLGNVSLVTTVVMITTRLGRLRRNELSPSAPSWVVDQVNLVLGEGVTWPARLVRSLWYVALGVFLYHAVTRGLLAFPIDWDTLMYHMPLVDRWVQEGSLYVPDESRWYVPGNNELLAFWLVAPFSGDFFASLNNIPSIVALALAMLELARFIGIVPPLSDAVAIGALCTYPVLRQAADCENDVASAGLFVALIYYTIRYLHSARRSDLLMVALACGLLLGTKYYAAGYAAIGLITALAFRAWSGGLIAAFRPAVAMLAGMALFGMYWYIRNLVAAGTPLYPQGITHEADLFARMRPHVWESTLLTSGRLDVWPMALQCAWGMAGPIQYSALLSLPFALVIVVLYHGSANSTLLSRRALATATVLSLGVFVITPNVVELEYLALDSLKTQYLPARFGLSFVCLAIVVAAYGLQCAVLVLGRAVGTVMTFDAAVCRTERSLWALVGVAIAGTIAYQLGVILIYHGRYSATDVVAVCDVALGLRLAKEVNWRGLLRAETIQRRIGAAAAILVVLMFLTGLLSRQWRVWHAVHVQDIGAAPIAAQIDRCGDSKSPICICDYRYYPFLGARREFRVCRPLIVPSHEWLDAYLRERGVSLIIARRDDEFPRRYASLRGMLESRRDRYVLLEASKDHMLYQRRRANDDQGAKESQAPEIVVSK